MIYSGPAFTQEIQAGDACADCVARATASLASQTLDRQSFAGRGRTDINDEAKSSNSA